MLNKFSIILPVFNGEKTIERAIYSIINQNYPYWELLVINDGSTDGTQQKVSNLMRQDNRIRMFITPENYERLISRNIGMRMTRNQWICWIDADDEYFSNYLEVLNEEISRNPDYGIFNFGAIFKQREIIEGKRYEKGWTIIPPLHLKEEGEGMESFPSGVMTCGGFIFKKKLLHQRTFFPETRIPYGDEYSFPALLVQKDEKFKEICKQDKEGNWLPLGNPFGDDYAFFWWLTRENKSKCLDVILSIHHIRI